MSFFDKHAMSICIQKDELNTLALKFDFEVFHSSTQIKVNRREPEGFSMNLRIIFVDICTELITPPQNCLEKISRYLSLSFD